MKTQWIPTDSKEPIEEHECEDRFFFEHNARQEVDRYLGGNFEFVTVLHDGKRRYMLVNEFGATIPLPVNARATDIYHNAQVKPQCKSLGIEYNADQYAQIHGPAILVEEEMT